MIAIGLMSGTSVDGIDAALVEIKRDANKTNYCLLKFITLPYDQETKNEILKSSNVTTSRIDEVCSLNFKLGYLFVKAIDELLLDTNYQYHDISFVASHGQTIWHNPHQNGTLVPSTLQIGEATVISGLTGIRTISNFRSKDIVAGGEGAPLVPMSEYVIFSKLNKNIILQNIGGISNLTYIKKDTTLDDVIAFDCGPGNMMIDYFMNKLYNKPYDDGGKIALSGKIINQLLSYLQKDEFTYRLPPKSTGREKYSSEYMEQLFTTLNLEQYPKEDIICTITEFTVYSICYQYQNFIKDIDQIIISGGGAHNQYILKRINEIMNIEVVTQEALGYDSDAKEAIAFVVLGDLSLQGKNGNVCKATGAKKGVVLGTITL